MRSCKLHWHGCCLLLRTECLKPSVPSVAVLFTSRAVVALHLLCMLASLPSSACAEYAGIVLHKEVLGCITGDPAVIALHTTYPSGKGQ